MIYIGIFIFGVFLGFTIAALCAASGKSIRVEEAYHEGYVDGMHVCERTLGDL